jgi:DDE superfamily endonuclease
VNAEFVAAMEDVLELYEEPYDPLYPTVCFDEKPLVLHAEVRPNVPAQPGQPVRIDCEYERRGTANLFFLVEPLRGWRQVSVTTQRTKQDYAQQMRWLVDVAYPEAEYVRVVQDNLNTHTPGALYEAFSPEEARRILRRLEFHYTPKHASWLNMAEIEIGVFQRSCLQRRLADEQQVRRQVAALQQERNAKRCTSSWRFTAGDARQKLRRLYPKT